ncbi:cell division protein FtsQ/DivIB [Kineothrix sedimenti]|uniref:FtsQ-type POTRA domain-containing protein n=1 Tax=Kineothrix sedimenti TaxID=3123317 RepID=A0ABZ3ETN4_9FIRM
MSQNKDKGKKENKNKKIKSGSGGKGVSKSKNSNSKAGSSKKGGSKNGSSKNINVKSSSSKVDYAKSVSSKKVDSGRILMESYSSRRPRGTNLRLVKNGDLPVDPPAKRYERNDDWLAQHKSLVIIGISIFVLAALLLAGYYYIITTYTVTTVYVDGNVHYTNEEVMDMVMKGRYGNNSLYLATKYKDKGVEGVPFVEKMDVNILSPNTIRINVYEKAFAGYVEYLGQYMYFDKDGIVAESSQVKTAGVPQVTGLSFDYIILNEPLPVENDTIFKQILSITQLLEKYSLSADKIYFDASYSITLFFGGVKVTLGTGEDMDEKIMKLQYILPELEGKNGTIPLENYTEDTKSITFDPD